MITLNETQSPPRDCLPFVWSIEAEDVRSTRSVVALVVGGRSTFEPRQASAPRGTGECSFFVESSRGEVVVQVLAELDSARVFVSMRFDLAASGVAESLKALSSQSFLTIHAFAPDGAPLGSAIAPLWEARRAWITSALDRAARAASTG